MKFLIVNTEPGHELVLKAEAKAGILKEELCKILQIPESTPTTGTQRWLGEPNEFAFVVNFEHPKAKQVFVIPIKEKKVCLPGMEQE